MHIDTLLPTEVTQVADRARELADLGFDGAFSFEGVGDVFLPLALAAQATDLTLYSNIAVAFPRSAMHLAYTAWDLQKLSQGRFMLGLGTQVKANIERRFSATWSHPVERMADMVGALKAIFACWQDGERLDHRGPFSTFTLMQPTFNPGPAALGSAPGPGGGAGPAHDPDGGVGGRRGAAAPVHVRVVLPGAHAGGGRRRSGRVRASPPTRSRWWPPPSSAPGATRPRWRSPKPAPAPCSASTARRRRTARCSNSMDGATCRRELNDLVRQGRWGEMADRIDDEVLDTLSIRAEPAQVGAAVRRRFGTRPDRIGFYLPYAIDPACIAEVRAGFD